MATTTEITTSYAGEFAGKYVAAALLTSHSIDAGGVTVKANVKNKEVLKRLSTDDLIANGTCDFAPTSTITLTEKILTPKEFQVNLSLCKKDFRSDWEALSMGYSAFDVLPKTFADFLIGHVAAKVAHKNELNIWRGVTANAGEYDGFETLLTVDADLPTAQEIAGTASTAANIITELGKIIDAVTPEMYAQAGLKLYLPINMVKTYIRALGGFGASGLGANGINGMGTQWYTDGSLSFDGVPIFMANGMNSNNAICTYTDNLFFGTGLLSDLNQVKVIDMADIDGSQNVRLVMRFTAGVQYAVVEDIVTYGIPNSAN